MSNEKQRLLDNIPEPESEPDEEVEPPAEFKTDLKSPRPQASFSNVVTVIEDNLDQQNDIKMVNHSMIENEDNDKMCRICFETDPEVELFNPCRCSGTSKWIHRSCLDDWRAHNQEAFDKCFECQYQYRTTLKQPNITFCRRFNLYLAQHGLQFYCLNQLVIFTLALLSQWLDQSQEIIKLFEEVGLANSPEEGHARVTKLLDYNYFYYYMITVMAFIVFWAVLFLGNLICGIRKNRWLYLKGFFRTSWVTMFCLSFLVVIPFMINMFLGTFFLTLAVQIFLRNHYLIKEGLDRAQKHEVLCYDPQYDAEV